MSANADDVIPASAMAPPSAPSSVDDIIPTHALHPMNEPKEISEGPMGFINGVAGLAGKAILNIPYAAASGTQDLLRMATGADEKSPDSSVVSALHFPLNENESNVASSIANVPMVSKSINAVKTVANEDFPLPDQEKRALKDVASIVPLAGAGSNLVRRLGTAAEALPMAETAATTTTKHAFDSAPIEGGLPSDLSKDRAAVLQRVGIENARNSALAGDAKAAATDFQLSKFDEPAGAAAKAQFDAEKTALQRHAANIIDETGGTAGTDEDALHARGQTIAAPFDRLRQYFDTQKESAYKAAGERAAGAPIGSLENTGKLLKDPDFTETLLAKDQGSLLNSVQRQFQRFQALNPEGMTVENAENFRKWLNQVWTPENSSTLGKVKGALDEDVLKGAGEDIYGPARKIVQTEAQTLDNPKGVSKLMDFDPKNPLNRTTPYAKIPDTLTRLDPGQFDNVIKTLDTMPEELQSEAQAAKAEIKAHLANKVLDAGSSTQGQWNAPAVSKVIKANSAKLQSAFADQPETLEKIKDLESAGKILKVDQSYPGAAAQAANILKRGAMSSAVAKGGAMAGGSIGGTAGAILGGPPGAVAGTTAGATIGGSLGGKVSQGMTERAALKKWQSGTTKLSDLLKSPP